MKKSLVVSRWSLVVLVVMILLVGAGLAQAQMLQVDYLKSWESSWAGMAVGAQTWTGELIGSDTITTVTWLGGDMLNPEANDLTFVVRSDTSLGATGSSPPMRCKLFPVVAAHLTHPILSGYGHDGAIVWQKGIIPTEIISGSPLTAFTINPDSVYVFHSVTWWGGIEVVGVLGRWWKTTTDSCYFDVISQYRGNR